MEQKGSTTFGIIGQAVGEDRTNPVSPELQTPPVADQPKRMSAVNKLISYIRTLTPEQVEKAVSQLPQVISTIAEQAPLDPRKESLQNQ